MEIFCCCIRHKHATPDFSSDHGQHTPVGHGHSTRSTALTRTLALIAEIRHMDKRHVVFTEIFPVEPGRLQFSFWR